MADLAERIANLSPARRQLLERLSSKQLSQQAKTYPLSYAQQRLWFLDQLEPGSAVYNIPMAIRMAGDLSRPAFWHALMEIVRRHEVLRTRFRQRNGVAVQEVSPEPNLSMEEIDLQQLEIEARKQKVTALIQEEITTPFDLARGPLLRTKLLQLAEKEHVLVMTMHHIVSDGWSMRVMEQEFVELYKAYLSSRPPQLPELEFQYGDFAIWQRGWLQSGVMESQLAYWKQKLDGAGDLELPTDYRRPAVRNQYGAYVQVNLDSDLTKRLKELCQREGVTLYMALLAGLQTALMRESRLKDLVIGTPIANRNRMETENLIGFFINTLLFRAGLNVAMSFRDLLRQVQETSLEAYEHQDLPFEKLVEAMPRQDLSRTPLFQVLFVLQNIPQTEVDLPGLQLSPVEFSFDLTKVELTLVLGEGNDRIEGSLQYDTALFSERRMRRLAGSFCKALKAMVEDASQRIMEYPLLEGEERRQVLEEWGKGEKRGEEGEGSRAVHEDIDRQAKTAGERVAIEYEEERMTYRELNERANQLGRYLRQEEGVKAEVCVGICMERSPEMIVGILGVLKAGGVYVPLDPNYPDERLKYMVKDSGVEVVLVDRRGEEVMTALKEANEEERKEEKRVIKLKEEWGKIGSCGRGNVESGISGENLAYVMYTSGSTGRPKGVGISHRALANQVAWAKQAFGMKEDDRFLQKASFSFDASVEEILVPLVAGAPVVLAKAGGEMDVEYLAQLVEERGVTCIDLTPSLLQAMVEQGEIDRCVRVRLMISGGEELRPELVRKYASRCKAELGNTYGPTEATVQATYLKDVVARVEGESSAGKVTIGGPIRGVEVYVMDEGGGLAGEGVVGELCIGGEGLGRGYLNQGDKTAEKFVPNPFTERTGARMYRTGDLVRWSEAGELEYQGRGDEQVKMRGYRIELGEIEEALLRCESVKQAAVIVRDDEPGDKRLVAYVVARQTEGEKNGRVNLRRSELRDQLKKELPGYMLPRAYVQLDDLPTTPNGKLDRKRLPKPGGVREETGRKHVSPTTAEEEILCGIWEEVLGQERVGVEDNFFELGGHSLVATQLISRVRRVFGVEMPLRKLFESPTVRELAEQIERNRSGSLGRAIPPLQRARRPERLPLSFAQQRLWFIDQLEPGRATYNMPSALRLNGELRIEVLEKAFTELVRRHESLRTRFAEEEGEAWQVIEEPKPIRIGVEDLTGFKEWEREAEAERRVEEEAEQPFDLEHGPLLRVRLLRLGEEEHALLVTMHHIVSDGWSMGVMVREFADLYRACLEGDDSPLPELELQYADYALWQRGWLQGQALEEQLGYWRKQLDGMVALEMPAQHGRVAPANEEGACLAWRLSPELSGELKRLGRRQGTTLFMTLLAGFQVLLSRYSGQEDIGVGAPIAGRRWAETEGLIGFFVNTLVLRTDLSGGPNFVELMARVKETTLGAYGHQDLPFEKLVEELQPERNLEQTPLFRVMFILQNAPATDLKLAGLKVTEIGDRVKTEKFEMTMVTVESIEGQVVGELSYRSSLYGEAEMRQLLRHWENLLQGIVREPERPVAEVEMLTEGEKEQILVEWNRTKREYEWVCVHQLISEQAKRTPAAVAVEHEGRKLTYGELNRRTNQLAHYLRKLGVRPEVLVGVCMERSLEMVIGMLGILKAGGAYVPLDPEYPADRLKFMMADGKVFALLTQSRFQELLSSHPALMICLEGRLEEISRESSEEIDSGTDPQNLAYVIYTSGSTGKPKGVAIRHESVGILLNWAREVFGTEDLAAVLASTSICFDLSVFEIFVTLSCGGKVIMAANALELPRLSQTCDVTLINTVPSAMAELVRMRSIPDSVRVVNLAGEALHGSLVKQTTEMGIQRIFNLYGPSEDTTYSTYARVEHEDENNFVPIGRPVSNTQIYLMDAKYQPVPVGVAGELYIGGAGLARGYLNRPDLTAERFVANPFGREGGERLYRTGDLARYRPDGTIEFTGRVDHQVKLRGFRIELGEIEAALNSHDAVEQAIVMLREDQPGEKRLVGYVVKKMKPAEESQVPASQIMHWQDVWQQLYEWDSHDAIASQGDFNLAGWRSSYTGDPIPEGEMRIWLEETVARLRKLRASRILEIGCGTGLLLTRLAADCDGYIGIDFSEVVLERLGDYLGSRPDLGHVVLHRGMAHELSFANDNSADLVILNSVVQYFPSMDYLLQVLSEAVRIVRPEGHIFIGDVRNLALLEAYHTSVQMNRAPSEMSLETLLQNIQQARIDEEELVLAPALFAELAARWKKIGSVELVPKRGAYDNELSRFRYDVTFKLGKKEAISLPKPWVPWDEAGEWRAELERILRRQPGLPVGVRGIRHSSTAPIIEAIRLLHAGDSAVSNVGELRRASDGAQGEDLDEVIRFVQRLGTECSWQMGKVAGVYDLVLNPVYEESKSADDMSIRFYRQFGNEPAQGDGTALVQSLQEYLRQSLPDHMVPSALMVLGSWPLTPNGKVDRRSLPGPERRSSKSYRAPRTPQEEMLVEIFAQVLKQERVGVEDNFFGLGGHSLLATQLISRVRRVFGVEMPLRRLFEAPTVRALAQQIEQERRQGKKIEIPPIKHSELTGGQPLSYAQQRLWFLDQLEPGRATYNIPVAVRFGGELDKGALRRSLEEIVRRHEILRARIWEEEGVAVQEVMPATVWEMEEEDLQGWRIDDRETEMKRRVKAEAETAFDLERGGLFRARLFQMGEQDHVLMVNMHHIVSDGWSMGVMEREFGELYRAFLEGEKSPLAELEYQYGDYAAWQREWLHGEILQEQVGYWRKQLAGVEALDLRIGTEKKGERSGEGAEIGWQLSADTSRKLRELCQREGVTVFMLLLAGFQSLLSRYSGRRDVTVGIPIAGRRWSETEGMIGFFVNTLAMRSRWGGEESFSEILKGVRERSLEAHEHQDVPFEKLVEELQPERDLSRTPFFQVMFVLQHVEEWKELRLPGLKMTGVEIEGGMEKFEMTMTVLEGGEGGRIAGGLSYRKDLFDAESMRRMVAQWEILLRAIVKEPERRIEEYSLLGEVERRQVLEEWNQPRMAYAETGIHEQFATQAKRTPDATALVYEDRQVTYAELECKANQLAHRLQRMGVGPEAVVGICTERSLEMVIGIVGILKAGGAYLPLDPNYPPERLGYMLEDAGVELLLTQTRTGSKLPPCGAQVLNLEEDWSWLAEEATDQPQTQISSQNAAYVIYTSGSTGRPKGVVVSHGNVTRLFNATQDWFQFTHQDVWTMFHSYAFDFSVWELWGALLYGGRLEIVPYWTNRAPEAFYEFIRNRKVTVLNQTPSAFRQLSMAEETERHTGQELSLRLVIFGGEALEMNSLGPWFARHGDVRPSLVNMYGITETTVHVTCERLTREMAFGRASLIGRRIPDLQLYVLTPEMQLTPIGVAGEMYVGGPGLTRGYLNRAELTASRFVPNPFSRDEGERLYRTGDLARVRTDGNIEYLGRIDQQVKIRGHRIELGEIETTLQQHAAVKQAVVIAREDAPGQKRLVAYVVMNGDQKEGWGEDLEKSGMRDFLKQSLPEYMVPSAFVLLQRLPLTANGKLDRKALPLPKLERDERNYEGSRSQTEEILCGIWEDLLRVGRIGVHDDFFELGGHSLLAVQLISRVRRLFGVKMPLRRLFEMPTVRGLGEQIEQERGKARGIEDERSAISVTPAIELKRGSKRPLFFVHGAGGGAFSFIELARRMDPERPLIALQDGGIDQPDSGRDSIEMIAAEYVKAVRDIQPDGPYLLGGWSMGGLVAFEMARLLLSHKQAIGFLGLIDSYPGPFTRRRKATKEDDEITLRHFLLNLGVKEQAITGPADSTPLEKRLEIAHRDAVEAGVLRPGLDQAVFERLFKVYCRHIRATESYRPRWTDVTAHLWQATGVSLAAGDGNGSSAVPGELVSTDQAAAEQRWRKTTSGMHLSRIPGDHFTILQEPYVRVLANALDSLLERIDVGLGQANLSPPDSHPSRLI